MTNFHLPLRAGGVSPPRSSSTHVRSVSGVRTAASPPSAGLLGWRSHTSCAERNERKARLITSHSNNNYFFFKEHGVLERAEEMRLQKSCVFRRDVGIISDARVPFSGQAFKK